MKNINLLLPNPLLIYYEKFSPKIAVIFKYSETVPVLLQRLEHAVAARFWKNIKPARSINDYPARGIAGYF